MFFEFSITTPALTTQKTPTITTAQLNHGIINQVDAIFPGGCAALMHFQVFYQLFQIFPSNINSSFASDNEKISWAEAFHLNQPPYQVTVITWNDDDLYEHTLKLRFAMFAEKIPDPPKILNTNRIDLDLLESLL